MPGRRNESRAGWRFSWVLLVAAVLLPVVLLTVVALRAASEAVERLAQQKVASVGQLGAELLRQDLKRHVDLVSALGELPSLRQAIAADDSLRARGALAAMVGAMGEVDQAVVLRPDGSVLASYPADSARKDFAQQRWFKRVLEQGGVQLSGVVTRPDLGREPALLAAKPVLSQDQRLQAVVVLYWPLSNISRLLQSMRADPGQVFLISPDGHLIDSAGNPRPLSSLRWPLAVEQARQGQGFHGQYRDPITNQDVFVSLVPMETPQQRWVVLAQERAQATQHDIARMVHSIEIAALVLLAGGLVVALLLSRGSQKIAHLNRQLQVRNRELQQLSALVEHTDEAVIATTTEGVITSWNRGAQRVYGYSAKEAIGKNIAMLSPPGDQAKEQEILASIQAGKPLIQYERIWLRRDGTPIHISATTSPIRDAKDVVVGAVSLAHDITERHRAQRLFRDLLEGAPDAAVVVDTTGKIVLANAQADRLFGYSREELLGMVVEDLLPQGVRARHVQHRLGFNASPRARPMGLGMDLFARKKDGSAFPVEISLSPLETHSGMVIFASIRDITQRRAAEQQLRKWEALFRHAGWGVAIMEGPENRLQAINPAFLAMHGYHDEEDLHGRPLSDLLAPGARLPEVDPSTDHQNYETVHCRKDGLCFPVLCDVVQVRDGQGNLLYRAANFQNIAQRKAVEDQVRHLNATLEQRVQERTAELTAAVKEHESFTYTVSHDLRSPLRAIDGFTRILLDEFQQQLPAPAQRYLNLICNNARQMGNLVDDLLSYARLGRRAVEREPVQMKELVEESLQNLQMEQQGRQVKFQIADLPQVQADPVLLQQVWTNLLSNALKFTSSREVATIEIGCRESDQEWTFFVKDNGVGFDMKYADQLFGVFRRLHRAEEYEGTGVGLAIVQRAVNRHRGRVWAEAEPDVGATFFFTLPKELQENA